MRIIRCHPSRFDTLVSFVAEHNPQPEHHIGYYGLTPEDIRLTLRMFNWPFDRAARLAVVGNRIVGVLAADIDKEIGRAWLYGPLVVDEDDEKGRRTSESASHLSHPSRVQPTAEGGSHRDVNIHANHTAKVF